MGARGRQLTENMAKALADLTANPNQTTREVASKYEVSVYNFRLHVYQRGLPYRRERRRGPRNEEQRLSSPAYKEPTPEEMHLIEMRKAQLDREREAAPAEVRMKVQLGKRFDSLVRLWGDWIKK